MRHHLLFPRSNEHLEDSFFYCRNAQCKTAYFSANIHYSVEQLQSQQQIKDGMICFCFGISEAVFYSYQKAGNIKLFFQQLDHLAYQSECHCKIKNPAGTGCLKIFKALC